MKIGYQFLNIETSVLNIRIRHMEAGTFNIAEI